MFNVAKYYIVMETRYMDDNNHKRYGCTSSPYLDALKQTWEYTSQVEKHKRSTERCGVGGKANTNPGRQNARFKGSKIQATRMIRVGEEIFVPYRQSYKFKQEEVDEERSGWGVVGRRFYRDMG